MENVKKPVPKCSYQDTYVDLFDVSVCTYYLCNDRITWFISFQRTSTTMNLRSVKHW